MKTLMKTLLLTAAVALAYPALAADPASRPVRADVTKEQFLKQTDARFDAMDANKDGKVTAEERIAHRPGRGDGPGAKAPAEITKEQHRKYAEQRFNAMDSNKDGKISAEERRAMHKGKPGMMRGGCGPEGRGFGPGPRGNCPPAASAPAAK